MSESLYSVIDRVDNNDMVSNIDWHLADEYSIRVGRGGGSPFCQLTTSLLYRNRHIQILSYVEQKNPFHREKMSILEKEKLVCSTLKESEKVIQAFERELLILQSLGFRQEDNTDDLSFRSSIGDDSIIRVIRHEYLVDVEIIEQDGTCHIWKYDGASIEDALTEFFRDDSTSTYRGLLPTRLIDWAVRQ